MQAVQKEEDEVKDFKGWVAVQNVYKQTKSKRATADILGIARNTVRKLLELSEPPKYRRIVYKTKIDQHYEVIVGNKYRKVYCFSMILHHQERRLSHIYFLKYAPRQDYE